MWGEEIAAVLAALAGLSPGIVASVLVCRDIRRNTANYVEQASAQASKAVVER